MNILQAISSIDITGGGTSKSVADIALQQAVHNNNVIIFSTISKKPYFEDSPNENLSLYFAGKHSFKREIVFILTQNNFDILHGNGLWQMPVHFMANEANKRNIPYIISPHGMLEPWALNKGKWKKKLAMKLYQRRDIARATCIHATAQMEAENIWELGFKNPIAVIPNGIDSSEFPLRDYQVGKSKNTMLFLSRIHPKKGIEILISAWQNIDREIRQHWKVEIAGNGAANYIASLERLISINNLADEIKIIGPQFGPSKLETYHRADLFVLPTYSENFGIVVAEALSCGIPVITTKGTPWEELNTHNAGWWIDIGVDPLAAALTEAMQLSDEKRAEMGRNGRRLVEEKYSIEVVAKQMIQLYEWVLGKGEKPEFVYE